MSVEKSDSHSLQMTELSPIQVLPTFGPVESTTQARSVIPDLEN